MLTVYGFGAKTSSGFGIADQQGIGQIAIKYPYSLRRSQLPQKPEYPEKLRLFLEQYPNEDFQRKPKEWRKLHKASQSQQSSYAEARKAQSTYQEELKAYESELVKWKTEANAPPLPQRTENFNTLVEMVAKVSQIAEHLCQVKEISHEL
jgi:CRISPR-associated protein Cmr2